MQLVFSKSGRMVNHDGLEFFTTPLKRILIFFFIEQILMGAGLLGLEIALIVLEGHVARTYVCGIWAGILVSNQKHNERMKSFAHS